MPLDDLVKVIETLQQRIREHGDTLRQNEARTRVALIDPLLTALGWNVSDPSLVIPEYNVRGRRADYALLSAPNQPAATIEAKKLDEPLDLHQIQMLNYSNAAGINYAGLTDGNLWELYDVFERGDLEKRRILEVNLYRDTSFQSALKLLLLWRSNMASGQPVSANTPLLDRASSDVDMVEPVADDAPLEPGLPGEGWTSLADFSFVPGQRPPVIVRFPNGDERELGRWNRVLLESAEYLVRIDRLTPQVCPVPVPRSPRYSVHREAVHSDGKRFTVSRRLSNDLYCEVNVSGSSAVIYAKSLLQYCGQDLATIWLNLD